VRHAFNILIFLFISIIALAQSGKFKKLIPATPIGWVSDFEKDFSDEQLHVLDSIINLHEVETSNEIAVVTVEIDTITIKSLEEFEKFAFELAHEWGVGKDEKDNGITIVFSKKLRMIRIEIGEGLTAKLTDDEAKAIIDNLIIPEFRKSNYFDGILKGLSEIIKEIK
jgi:uncharacterized protein